MFHTLILVGNVGRDPEMRYTPAGQPITNFSVACNRKYTSSSGEAVSETIWFRVSAWGKLGEICNQYLRKGSRVLIEGRLNPDKTTGNPRIWNRQDGSPAASFEVTAGTVKFLTPKQDGAPGEASGDFGPEDESQAPHPEDDIPF